MSDLPPEPPIGFDVPEGWTPEVVVAIDQPVPLGTEATVRYPNGRTIDGLFVSHLYHYQCDGQPGDDYIVLYSPGTAHVTIVHQRDYRPVVSTEWAAGLREGPAS